MEQLKTIYEFIFAPPYIYIAGGLAAFFILCALVIIMRPRRRRIDEINLEFTSPGALQPKPLPGGNFAKVFMEYPPLERMSVYSVSNNTPFFFTENGKTGFYLPEGTVEIKAEYFWSKRGVLYTTETSASGVKKIQFTPARGGVYRMVFNTEKEIFTIS